MLALLLLQSSIADTANSVWSAFSTPVMILLVVLAIGLLMRSVSHRYVKVPPQKALIVYGGGKTRVVSGGAKLVMPFVEDYFFLDLSLFQFEVKLENVPNKDSVPVNVKASVSAKISNKEEMLPVASGIFGEASLKEISDKVRGIVDGHVRALIGQSNMETILRDQDTFKQQISNLVSNEMAKIGCEIIVLNIQEVSDPHGVIESLGKPMIAKVKADANIQEAEQTRRQTIETTNAQREAQRVAAGNNGEIAQAQRDLQVREAGYNAEIAREQAKAKQAGPLADAESRKAVVVAEVAVEESQTEAKTKLQAKVKDLKKAELDATLITQAHATAEQSVIVAEGQKKATVISAEAARTKLTIEAEGTAAAREKTAEGNRRALQLEGEGQAAKALAEGNAAAEVARKTGEGEAAATRAKLVADADGQTAQAAAKKANLLAEADGREANARATQAQLLAEAEGQKAKADAKKQELLAEASGAEALGLARAKGVEAELLAQAAGVQKLLDSFKDLTLEQVQMVRTKWLIEALPGMIEKAGEAGEKIMQQVAAPIAAAIGSIDNVTVYDSGSSHNGNGNGLERFAKIGPQALQQAFMSLQETGMLGMVSSALSKAGVDVSSLLPTGMMSDNTPKA